MPNNKKKKGGNKAKAGAARSNAANKDNLAGLDDILSNPEEIAAAQRQAVENGGGYKPKTGRENAQIGLKGFTQATQNPAMFTDAMSMLGDPSAVKEAEAMMNDPEFKSEINQYMDTLKNNSAFREAMAEAQRKYQALLADPAKMKEATDKYHAVMKARQDAAGTEGIAGAGKEGGGGVAGTGAAETGVAETGAAARAEAAGGEKDKGEETLGAEPGLDADGEPVVPEVGDDEPDNKPEAAPPTGKSEAAPEAPAGAGRDSSSA